MGYAGGCVGMFLAGYADVIAAGAQLSYGDYSKGQFGSTRGVSGGFDLILRFAHLPPSYFEPRRKFCRTTSFYCIFWLKGRFVREPV
jgi:hypothetical protein